MGIAQSICKTNAKLAILQRRSIASLREGGGPRSGGRSLRSFQYHLTSLSRTLPQSPSAPAPSRREPFSAISSAYINKSSHKPFDWSVGTFCCCVFSVKNNREKSTSFLFFKNFKKVLQNSVDNLCKI